MKTKERQDRQSSQRSGTSLCVWLCGYLHFGIEGYYSGLLNRRCTVQSGERIARGLINHPWPDANGNRTMATHDYPWDWADYTTYCSTDNVTRTGERER